MVLEEARSVSDKSINCWCALCLLLHLPMEMVSGRSRNYWNRWKCTSPSSKKEILPEIPSELFHLVFTNHVWGKIVLPAPPKSTYHMFASNFKVCFAHSVEDFIILIGVKRSGNGTPDFLLVSKWGCLVKEAFSLRTLQSLAWSNLIFNRPPLPQSLALGGVWHCVFT